MTFAIETKERLPDWTDNGFERYRMNQLTQILERRFMVVEEALVDIQLTNQGVIGGDVFAPIEHTHGTSEITDYPSDVLTVSNSNTDLFMAAIADVIDTTPTNNQVLKYSTSAFSGDGGWILDDFASAGNSLASLTDTNIGSPIVDGSILIYDLVSARWVDTDADTLPYVVSSGDQMTGDLIFGDTVSAAFGDGSDALINWDGADLIERVATGNIRLQVAGGEDGIVVASNGRVTVYDDNIPTLRTGVSTVEVWDGDSWEDVVLDTRLLEVEGTASEIDVAGGSLDLAADRTWTVGLSDDPIFPGSISATIPSGVTGSEPAAVVGMMRYDTTTGKLRVVDEGVWIDAISDPVASLDDLTDVTLTTPDTGGVLYKSAGDWIDTDAIIIDPTGEVVLQFNGTDRANTTNNGWNVDGNIIAMEDTGGQTMLLNMFNSNEGAALRLSNSGGVFQLYQLTGSGTIENIWVQMERDAGVKSFFNGVERFHVTDIGGDFTATGALTIPIGTTVQEPTPVNGMIRYDTDNNVYRGVVSGAWADLGGGGGTVDTVVGTTDEIVVDSSDAANPIVGIADNPVMPGTSDMILPIGTTAQEPTAADGMIRFDSDHERVMFAEGPTPAWRHSMSMFGEPTGQGQFVAWFASGQDTFLQVTMLETDFSSTISLSGSSTSAHLQFAHTNHADDVAAIHADGTNVSPMTIFTQQLGKEIELRTANAVAGSTQHLLTHADAGVDLGFDDNLVFGTIINGAYLDNHDPGDTDFEFYQDSVLKYTIQHWNDAGGDDEIRHISAVTGVPFVFSDGTDVAITAVPDGATTIGQAGDDKLRTAADSAGAAEINKGGQWDEVHAGPITVGTGTTRANSTITDDADLTDSVSANRTYKVELFLEIENASATPDFQFQFSVPTSASFDGISEHVDQDNTNNGIIGVNDATAETITLQAAEPKYVYIRGTLVVAGTAGTFALGWAQVNTDALNLTNLRATSWMTLVDIT